jgi:hypothetical protein
MRPILALTLFCACLSAVSAVADPLTDPNADAALRKTRLWMPEPVPKLQQLHPVQEPRQPVVKPTPQDVEPAK